MSPSSLVKPRVLISPGQQRCSMVLMARQQLLPNRVSPFRKNAMISPEQARSSKTESQQLGISGSTSSFTRANRSDVDVDVDGDGGATEPIVLETAGPVIRARESAKKRRLEMVTHVAIFTVNEDVSYGEKGVMVEPFYGVA
ncbi:hypothetical protein SAY86_000787 [Trapa natans]|uniref:Uncharacterized protein n=1 Tax=Trapa natans TaxID=22666 RepID=A0AAN7MBJ0_TRANT|nr:hypothetical protein SAY86_000787 [Trapa natans]